jgi:hypothetical protein
MSKTSGKHRDSRLKKVKAGTPMGVPADSFSLLPSDPEMVQKIIN